MWMYNEGLIEIKHPMELLFQISKIVQKAVREIRNLPVYKFHFSVVAEKSACAAFSEV